MKIPARLKSFRRGKLNFDEESPINIIANSFQDFKGNAVASAMNYHCTFNPLDKLREALEENKTLYERLLKAES